MQVDISTGIYSDFGIIACCRLEATEESHNLPYCEDTGGIALFGYAYISNLKRPMRRLKIVTMY